MTVSTKIDLRYRQVGQIEDVTDLVTMLFPGNHNQQHAAARILMALKAADGPLVTLIAVGERHGISRRTLERTRAKLARLGLIEHVTWMNSRYGGRDGWVLSGRMSTAVRQLADKIDAWRRDTQSGRAVITITGKSYRLRNQGHPGTTGNGNMGKASQRDEPSA